MEQHVPVPPELQQAPQAPLEVWGKGKNNDVVLYSAAALVIHH